jgi:hydroxyethylthiazole kinase-like uncharacterized protein yjeF
MTIGKVPVYLTKQIREFESQAKGRLCINGDTLMSRAGKAAFDYLTHTWQHTKRIVVFAGAGNNGGDGYVLAELAHERGFSVTVYQIGDHSKLSAEALHAYERCKSAKVPMEPYKPGIDLQYPNVIVDAICGIGLKGELRAEVIEAIDAIDREDVPVLALDVPTGVDAETGNVPGRAIVATATITFIGYKLGLLTGPACSYTGDIVLNDLQLPTDLFSSVVPAAEKIQLSAFEDYLKPRMRDWHKGMSGHVLIIGGDSGYAGATRMAGVAALRVGAGLVSVATHFDNATFLDTVCPELMCHGVHGTDDLLKLVDKADVVVLGPGLGQSNWAKELWSAALQSNKRCLVDADGLNLLAMDPHEKSSWVLTPHPGEAGRLLEIDNDEVQQDRYKAAQDIVSKFGGVCVLKGAGSLIVSHDEVTGICDIGNPGMATSGMGDILSGVIGGLIAQGVPPVYAAEMGVVIHAMAGDMAAQEGERGMMATDLYPFLRKLSNLKHHDKK